jgi:glutamate/tyrosine decarboxylase-like PLP-dependent enzyme
MSLPKKPKNPQQILQYLQQLKEVDVPWQQGKIFGYIFNPNEEAYRLIQDAFNLFLTENALDPTVFPSLVQLEDEIIGMAVDLMQGGEEATGNFTTGGTESILLALRTARDYAKANNPDLKNPEVILPHTAHAAFYKACTYLELTPVTVPVDDHSFKANPKRMEEAITDQTILLVASAPSYAHGVLDPVAEIGAIAQKHDLLFHVDACMGGMFLPFLRLNGTELPPFDFSVPGVTSISVDFHKYGYAAKGASSVLYRNAKLRKYQLFACANWPGYGVVNTTMLSSRSGGPMAACWAILNYMGLEGYQELAVKTNEATQELIKKINTVEGLRVLGEPVMSLVAISSERYNLFKLVELMKKRGWHLQVQLSSENSPVSIHLTITQPNLPLIDTFVEDLKASISELEKEPSSNGFSMEMLAPLLALPPAEMIDQFQQMSGMEQGALPDNMEVINTLLNQLEAHQREAILKEFLNRVFMPRSGEW